MIVDLQAKLGGEAAVDALARARTGMQAELVGDFSELSASLNPESKAHIKRLIAQLQAMIGE